MIVKIKNMQTGKDFEIEVFDEPILHLKLKIEENQGMPLNQ